MSRNIDDTRNRIGLESLDEGQRKKLFKDFIDHGGKVERRPKGQDTPARPRRGSPAAKKASPRRGTPATRCAPAESPKKKKGKTLFSAARITFRGRFLKVWGLGAKKLNERFVAGVKGPIKNALVDLDLITTSMLKGSSAAAREILSSSVGEYTLLYECILRLSDVYDEALWSAFETLASERRIPKASHISTLKDLFKRLYVLGQHRHACTLSVLKGIEIQKKLGRISPKDAARLSEGTRSRIDLLLHTFLQQLHIILCRIDGRYLALYSQKLDDFLDLGISDRIGYVTRREKKKRTDALKKVKAKMQETSLRDSKNEETEINLPKHVERGLPIVEEAIRTFEREHAANDKPDGRNPAALDRHDKMYRTLALLEQFDSQYSLVLTTGKILYNIDFVEQKKVDIKEELNHAYLLFSEARTEAMGYIETAAEIDRVQENKRLTEYQRATMLEKIEKKRLTISRNSRNRVTYVMKQIEEVLSTVITDYSSEKILLQNPEEKLRFDLNIDGNKKLDGKRTVEAIVETFLFAATFAFLLRYGKLSGASMMIDEEKRDRSEP